MQSVRFLKKRASVEADMIIVCDPEMECWLDDELQGAVSFNVKQSPKPVWMTTNGKYPIPKIVLVENLSNLYQAVSGKHIALALGKECSAEAAFGLLVKNPEIESLVFLCDKPEQQEELFYKEKLPLLKATLHAKNLIEAPSNLMTPKKFAECCLELKRENLSVEVYDEREIQRLGLEALLSVGKGSIHPPRLVVMHYQGAEEKPVALVGKGVCFDAGGIHLKKAYLNEMKWDKAGAGAVVGAIDALARMQIPVNVIAIVVLAENMPDGGALKPGDVINTLGGKTVEIVDTDCEGRLVLADGISYVQKYHSPQVIIDVGTLALETFGALGGKYAGLFSPDKKLSSLLLEAGCCAKEELWQLPLGSYYAEQIRSRIADLKNAGIERYGASSAAAEFLRAFVHPHTPWAHIDIAGVAWDIMDSSKGISGFGVRLLVEALKKFVKSS